MTDKYKCSICKQEFSDYTKYREHELQCDKCKTCKHAYYVYGTGFACPYSNDKVCSSKINFPKYELKEKTEED